MKYSILIFFFFYNFYNGKILAQCTSTGATNGSVFTNDASVGTVTWSNPSNAQLSDNIRSSAGVSIGTLLSSATTNYLIATGFGFSLPSMTSICGIQVEVEKSFQILLGVLSSVKDNSVKIIQGGVISGSEKASGNLWTSSDAYTSYGSSSDLWGLTWTPTDINSSNFGVAISAKVSSGLAALTINALIDHIRITVFYNTIVPVTFKGFNGEEIQDKVKLNWSTASKSNSSYFIPEKLVRGTNDWAGLNKVPASFYSSTEKFYESYDTSPEPDNVYRIKEVDIDDRAIYSKIISVHYKGNNDILINAYPNPANETINIHSSEPVQSLSLIDISGKEFLNNKVAIPVRDFKISTTKFAKGIYFLVIQTDSNRSTREIIIDR